MKWTRGLKLITAVILMLMGVDKFINILPDPILSLRAQEVLDIFESVGYALPLMGAVQIFIGATLFFKRSTPFGALLFFPLSAFLFTFYAILSPSALFLSLYLLTVSCILLYANRAFYSPVLLSLSNGKKMTFMQLKKSHFVEETSS